jgi:hypothetical protein
LGIQPSLDTVPEGSILILLPRQKLPREGANASSPFPITFYFSYPTSHAFPPEGFSLISPDGPNLLMLLLLGYIFIPISLMSLTYVTFAHI